MSTRTVTCALAPTPDQAAALKETVTAFNAACNYVSQVAWEERTFARIPLQKLTYYEVKARFHLPAQLAIHAIRKVADAYRISKEAPPTFRPLGGITYDCRVLRLVNLSVVSLTTLSGRIRIPLSAGGYQRNRLTGAILGETDLVYAPETKRWSLVFSVKTETPPVSNPEGFLGVDLGIKNIAADSDGTLYAGGKLRRYRKHQRRIRKRLQKLGTRGSRRLLVKRRRKEHRRATHVNHCISKQLVAAAKGTGRGIALEDLSGIHERTTVKKAQRAEHRGWSFHQLRELVEYKCADAGVAFVAVDARYTSRTCPKCGCVDKRNRPSQAVFHCIRCDFQGHADLIATLEIARRATVGWPSYPERQVAETHAEVLQGKVPWLPGLQNAHVL